MVDCDEASCLGLGGAACCFGTSIFEISSPSSAKNAIICPTGIFLEPSGA